MRVRKGKRRHCDWLDFNLDLLFSKIMANVSTAQRSVEFLETTCMYFHYSVINGVIKSRGNHREICLLIKV